MVKVLVFWDVGGVVVWPESRQILKNLLVIFGEQGRQVKWFCLDETNAWNSINVIYSMSSKLFFSRPDLNLMNLLLVFVNYILVPNTNVVFLWLKFVIDIMIDATFKSLLNTLRSLKVHFMQKVTACKIKIEHFHRERAEI